MTKTRRPFGFWTATAVVVGTMIGAGIFVLPSALAPLGWTAVVAWIVAGLGVLAIARVIAGLTLIYPDKPNILATCGDILGLLPARVLVWSYWVASWCSGAVLATTAAGYLSRFIPGLGDSPLRIALGGSVLVALLSALNLRGMKAAGRFQVATTLLKLMPLLAVIVIVAVLATTAPETYRNTPNASFTPSLLTPALAITFFAMIGFECASMVAERVHNPARNVVRATIAGLAITLIIYLIVSIGIIFAVPAAELQSTPAPVAFFVEQFWGRWAGDAVALFAAISAIGCLNVTIMLQGEVPLGMARGGQLPGWIAPTNRHDIAAWPLVVASVLAIILMLGSATSFGAQVLDFMLRLTTASSIAFYIGVCLAALAIGRMRGLAIVGILFSAWVLYGTGLEAGMLGLLLMVLAVPLHRVLGGRTDPAAITDPA